MGPLKDKFTKDGVTDYRTFWFIPAAFAALFLVLFVLTFRNKQPTQSA